MRDFRTCRALTCATLILLTVLGSAARAQAQGVLSPLGQLSLDGASLNDPRTPLAQRIGQARALGHLGETKDAVSLLSEALSRRPQQPLRDAILASLAERRSTDAVPELLRTMRARIGSTSLIFQALGAIGGGKVIEALVELLKANDRAYREPALRALSKLSPEHAAPFLTKALSDADAVWRKAALSIAIELQDEAWLPHLEAAWPTVDVASQSELALSLAKLRAGAGIPLLLKLERSAAASAQWLRIALAAALRAHGDAVSSELRHRALQALAAETAPPMRLMLRALARDDVNEAEIIAALRSEQATQRLAAARALIWWGHDADDGRDVLREAMLRERDANVYNALALACMHTSCERAATARDRVQDVARLPGDLLRAASLSREPHDKRLRAQLRHVLRQSSGHATAARVAAALAVAHMADATGWIVLSAALEDTEVEVRRAAVRSLAGVGHSDARAALLRFAALEPTAEVVALAEMAARLGAQAADDVWGKARSLIEPAVDPEPAPLAR